MEMAWTGSRTDMSDYVTRLQGVALSPERFSTYFNFGRGVRQGRTISRRYEHFLETPEERPRRRKIEHLELELELENLLLADPHD